MADEERPHLLAAFQAVLCIRKQMRPRLIQGGTVADRDHHVVKPASRGDVIVHLVGGDDRRRAALGHRHPALEHPWILGAKVVVKLAEDIILTERLLKTAEARFIVGGAQIEEVASVLGDSGERCSCLAFRLVGVSKGEQAAEVGVDAEIADDHHHVLAVDLEGGADERLHADFATCL